MTSSFKGLKTIILQSQPIRASLWNSFTPWYFRFFGVLSQTRKLPTTSRSRSRSSKNNVLLAVKKCLTNLLIISWLLFSNHITSLIPASTRRIQNKYPVWKSSRTNTSPSSWPYVQWNLCEIFQGQSSPTNTYTATLLFGETVLRRLVRKCSLDIVPGAHAMWWNLNPSDIVDQAKMGWFDKNLASNYLNKCSVWKLRN